MVGLGEGQGDGIATESVRLWSAGDGGGEGDEQGVLLAVSVERVRWRGWCSSLRKSTERAECSLLRIRGWDAMRRGLREGMERGWTTRSGDGWRGGGESGRTKMDIGAGKRHCSAAGVYKEQEGDLLIYRGSPDSVTGCQPQPASQHNPNYLPLRFHPNPVARYHLGTSHSLYYYKAVDHLLVLQLLLNAQWHVLSSGIFQRAVNFSIFPPPEPAQAKATLSPQSSCFVIIRVLGGQ